MKEIQEKILSSIKKIGKTAPGITVILRRWQLTIPRKENMYFRSQEAD